MSIDQIKKLLEKSKPKAIQQTQSLNKDLIYLNNVQFADLKMQQNVQLEKQSKTQSLEVANEQVEKEVVSNDQQNTQHTFNKDYFVQKVAAVVLDAKNKLSQSEFKELRKQLLLSMLPATHTVCDKRRIKRRNRLFTIQSLTMVILIALVSYVVAVQKKKPAE